MLPDASRLAANEDAPLSSRLDAEMGYGIALFGGGFTGTPHVGWGCRTRRASCAWAGGSPRRTGATSSSISTPRGATAPATCPSTASGSASRRAGRAWRGGGAGVVEGVSSRQGRIGRVHSRKCRWPVRRVARLPGKEHGGGRCIVGNFLPKPISIDRNDFSRLSYGSDWSRPVAAMRPARSERAGGPGVGQRGALSMRAEGSMGGSHMRFLLTSPGSPGGIIRPSGQRPSGPAAQRPSGPAAQRHDLRPARGRRASTGRFHPVAFSVIGTDSRPGTAPGLSREAGAPASPYSCPSSHCCSARCPRRPPLRRPSGPRR